MNRPASSTFRTFRGAAGFTLIEVLVVLGIIGLITGIAVNALKKSQATYGEASSVTSVAALIRSAASYSNNRRVASTLQLNGRVISVNDLNGTMIDSNAQFTVPPNVNLPAGSAGVLLGFRPDGTVLFSGDTLFPGGVGNTKAALGDFDAIIRSVDNKLFTLPAETVVMPGHGVDTTIGAERPHLREWVDRGW